MYKKILVPLDGSELAECSLSHVKAIATGCSVPEVVLLRVVEPLPGEGMIAAELGEEWQNNANKNMLGTAKTYLEKISDDLKRAGISVSTAIIEGFAADEILDFAKKNNVDLIIMSTHGRSGVARWAFGSVADRVVRHAAVPVMAIASPACRIA